MINFLSLLLKHFWYKLGVLLTPFRLRGGITKQKAALLWLPYKENISRKNIVESLVAMLSNSLGMRNLKRMKVADLTIFPTASVCYFCIKMYNVIPRDSHSIIESFIQMSKYRV